MWERWKRLKIFPWDWLTDGVKYEEHIASLEAQDHMYNEAERIRAEHESKAGKKGEITSKGF